MTTLSDKTGHVREHLAGELERLRRYALALSRRRDVAEDLVQATCLRALERPEQFQPGTQIDRWLLTILHSIWMNELRSRRMRRGRGFVDPETALVADGIGAALSRVFANEMILCVQDLPEAQRAVVFLVYVEEMTYRETAEILDIPIGTVMSRLFTARAALVTLSGAKERL